MISFEVGCRARRRHWTRWHEPCFNSDRGMRRAETMKGVALLLVDVINAFDFEDAALLIERAEKVAVPIRTLAQHSRDEKVPVIYVNDNFGMWTSNFQSLVDHCLASDKAGRHIVEQLLPESGDFSILKPRHSGFLATPLELLLAHLQVNSVVLAGFATDLCVLFTALDAHARGFHVVVPNDCTAANTQEVEQMALGVVHDSLRSEVCRGQDIDFHALAQREKRKLF